MRPFRPVRGPAFVSAALLLAACVAGAGSLVLREEPARPATAGPTPGHTGHPASHTGTTTADGSPVGSIAMVATTNRVELLRHKGSITGDGSTVYVANRTAFRPAATKVAIPPRIRARAWVVVDLDTGRLLGKHHAREELPQASTMKLLTALTAVRTIAPRASHRITKFEASQTCSCAGVERGRVYRRDTLLAGMLLPSGNDAAEAVAGSHPVGRRAFYRAMNRLADRLGARDTVARNASGLTATGSHSTARDLVVLLRAAVADDTIAGILAKQKTRITTANGRHSHVVWRSTDYVNRYAGSLGKSGYTTPAKNTLVVTTDIDGHRIAFAGLGAPSGYSTSGARALTEWAGANFDGLESVGRLPRP